MGEIPTMPEDEDERVDKCTGRGQLGLLIPLTLRSDKLTCYRPGGVHSGL